MLLRNLLTWCTLAILCAVIKEGTSIQCYECNSHNDSRCLNAVLPEGLKKDCADHESGTKYTMCRKITQAIEFEVNGMPPDHRVIRGCGWDESNYKGRCYQRSGFGGRQEVCSCLDDLCNSATVHVATVSVLMATAAIYLFC